MKGKLVRQGDVLMKPVVEIPKDAERREIKGRIVLAYGEVTGHAHAIDDAGVDVFVKPDGVMYLRVTNETSISHEEHGTILLPPGNYQRVIQREYSPAEIRDVAD